MRHQSYFSKVLILVLMPIWVSSCGKDTNDPNTGTALAPVITEPAQVQNLAMNSKTSTEIAISWDAPVSVSKFRILAISDSSKDDAHCNGQAATETSGLAGGHVAYTISGLSAATQYIIRVCSEETEAIDGGTSQVVTSSSSAIDVKTSDANPAEVANLVLKETLLVTRKVHISWSASQGATQYRFAYKAGSTAPTSCTPAAAENATTGIATGLNTDVILKTAGVYSFRVCAEDPNASIPITAGVTGKISIVELVAPSQVKLVGGDKSITVSWSYTGTAVPSKIKVLYGAGGPNRVIFGCTAPTIDGWYNSQANVKGEILLDPQARSYTITNLAAQTSYLVSVCAYNSLEEFASSTPLGAFTSGAVEEITAFDFRSLPWSAGHPELQFSSIKGLSSAGFGLRLDKGDVTPRPCEFDQAATSWDTMTFGISGGVAGEVWSVRFCGYAREWDLLPSDNPVTWGEIPSYGIALTIKLGSSDGSTPAKLLKVNGLCQSSSIPSHYQTCGK